MSSADPAAGGHHRHALVVFEDRLRAGPLRWLREGFRHCFCVLGDERRWTICDPLKSAVILRTVDDLPLAQLARAYADLGALVLVGRPAPPPADGRGGGMPLAPLTCVEIVKRLLGVSAPAVLTPYQLYTRLRSPAHGFTARVDTIL